MGAFLSNNVDQTIKKNQEYIAEMNRIKMERWIQMHYQIKERETALEISRAREFFYWMSSFYAITLFGTLSRFQRTKRIGVLSPLIPLSFLTAYCGDLAERSSFTAEADMIMQHESELLEWPGGLPTVASIDEARVETEMDHKMHPHQP